MESLTPNPRGGFSTSPLAHYHPTARRPVNQGAGFTHRRTAATSLFSLTGALGQQNHLKLILQKPSYVWFPGKKTRSGSETIIPAVPSSSGGIPAKALLVHAKHLFTQCLGLPECSLLCFPRASASTYQVQKSAYGSGRVSFSSGMIMPGERRGLSFMASPQFWVGLGLGLYGLSPFGKNHLYTIFLSVVDFGSENAQPQRPPEPLTSQTLTLSYLGPTSQHPNLPRNKPARQ